MRMRVDDVMNPQAVAHRRDLIAIDLVDLGIDQRRGTSFLAADQIGLAAAGRDLLEDHACPRSADVPRVCPDSGDSYSPWQSRRPWSLELGAPRRGARARALRASGYDVVGLDVLESDYNDDSRRQGAQRSRLERDTRLCATDRVPSRQQRAAQRAGKGRGLERFIINEGSSKGGNPSNERQITSRQQQISFVTT